MGFNPATGQPACDVCGGEPAGPATFRSVVALVIAWQLETRRGDFCRDCGVAVHRQMTKHTMVGGWWGFAVLGSLVVIFMNTVTAVGLSGLPEPAHRPGRPLVPGRPVSRSPVLIAPTVLLVLLIAVCYGVPRL